MENTLKCSFRTNQIIRLHPLSSSCSGKVDESSFYISPYSLNANSISGIKTFIIGGGLEIMHFWYWVMLHPSIGKGVMITNAEFNATPG